MKSSAQFDKFRSINSTRFIWVAMIFSLVASCSQNNPGTNPASSEGMVMDKYWKTYDYKRNGTADAGVVAQQPTFQFRSDAKLYFSQISPVFRDTFNYIFITGDNIKLTKPQLSATFYINLKIDRITDHDFDFTMTDNQTVNVYNYKTTGQ